MKLAILALVCLSAALAAEKEYPLKVQLFESTWSNAGYGHAHGYGRGNIEDAERIRGFEFTYDCLGSYPVTVGNNAYSGRWKKDDQRMVIQGTQIGGTSKTECELRTTVHNDIYVMKAGQFFLITQEQYKKAMENLRPADKDPAHYPLKISILKADWQAAHFGSVGGGMANVVDGANVDGYNFASNCAVTFPASPGFFAGKWTADKARLVLLTKAIGESQYYTCELKVDPIFGVYVKNNDSGAIGRLTKDEFKAFLQKRADAQAKAATTPAVQSTAAIASVAGAKAKVNVLSSPDGADIEIDGKYVGSTPSVMEWPVGDHAISIKKPGYKDWGRNMTLTAGEVKVNANLEKAGSN